MKVFFCATENDKSESKDQFFAGDWCFFSNTNELKNFNDKIGSIRVLSNKNELDFEIQSLKNFLFKELKSKLNNLHNTNYSEKFWRFLLDPWLTYFIDSYTIKWKIIYNLESSFDQISYNSYSSLGLNFSYDVRDYKEKFDDNDDFHQRQFQNIIEFKSQKKNHKFIKQKNDKIFYNVKLVSKPFFFKYFFKKILNFVSGWFFSNNKFFIYKSSLGLKNHFILNFKLKQFPHISFCDFEKESYRKNFSVSIDRKIREKLKISINTKDDIKKFLSEVLIQELPTCYVEKFDEIINQSKKILIKPKMIVNSAEILHNSLFKFWAALRQETSNSVIIYPDHGGTLGIIDHQDISKYLNYRFTWHKPVEKNDIQVPSLILSRISEIRNSYKNNLDKILYISFNKKKYYHSFYNSPKGIETLETIREFKSLKNNLTKKIKEKLYVKTYTKDDQNFWLKNHLWFDDEDQDKIILTQKKYNDIFRTSKIIVCNYPKTSFCEAMVSGPTIILLNLNHWQQTHEFLKLKDKLKDNKILFDNGNLAAKHINSIWDHPLDWWNNDKVLKVREEFINNFAMMSESPIEKWSEELEKIRKKNYL